MASNSSNVAVVEQTSRDSESWKKMPIQIGERTGTYSGERGYYLHPTADEVKRAVATDFEEFVEPDAREYAKKWVGHISPVLIIVLSLNLERMIRLDELTHLGGPDGDGMEIDSYALKAALKAMKVNSFDDLPANVQKSCTFQPGWGLLIDNGTICHVLNMMLGNEKFPTRKPMVVALSSMKLEDVKIVGNRFMIYLDDKVVEKVVSGCRWNVSPDGTVKDDGKGNVRTCCKIFEDQRQKFLNEERQRKFQLQNLLAEEKRRKLSPEELETKSSLENQKTRELNYECCSFTMDPQSFMEKLRKIQSEKKLQDLEKKRALSDDFISDILKEAEEQ